MPPYEHFEEYDVHMLSGLYKINHKKMELSSMYLRSLAFLRNNDYDPNAYPFTIPAIKELDSISFKANVTFLVGENGSGKSTLHAQILNFDTQPIAEIRYEDTLHYIITRRFLENRNVMLKELFED
jgi:predicted ATPase